jgi:hypothetical protein
MSKIRSGRSKNMASNWSEMINPDKIYHIILLDRTNNTRNGMFEV